jgi:3-dehydrosphinganine reductase
VLQQELLPHDIRVHIMFPSTILSPGFEEEQKRKPAITKKIEEADTPQTPEQIAEALLKGLNFEFNNE